MRSGVERDEYGGGSGGVGGRPDEPESGETLIDQCPGRRAGRRVERFDLVVDRLPDSGV